MVKTDVCNNHQCYWKISPALVYKLLSVSLYQVYWVIKVSGQPIKGSTLCIIARSLVQNMCQNCFMW
jgi:hypothetical protein